MKKIKLVGFVVLLSIAALLMIGCLKGGTLFIENQTGEPIHAIAVSANNANFSLVEEFLKKQRIENDSTAAWVFDQDGKVAYMWWDLNDNDKYGSETIEKGGKKTVKISK